MKTSFKIDYQTLWGQVLFITGSAIEFGEWDPNHALPMKTHVSGEWEFECDFPSGKRLE